MKKTPVVYLDDILESIGHIRDYIKGKKFKDFDADTRMQDAVIRRLEVIGEAAKRVPKVMRDACPEIPWKNIAGMRDMLIHEYAGVSAETVWKTANEDLDALEECVKKLKS